MTELELRNIAVKAKNLGELLLLGNPSYSYTKDPPKEVGTTAPSYNQRVDIEVRGRVGDARKLVVKVKLLDNGKVEFTKYVKEEETVSEHLSVTIEKKEFEEVQAAIAVNSFC